GLTSGSSAATMIAAYWNTATAGQAAYDVNLAAVKDVLVNRHAFALSNDDLAGIAYVYHAFYWSGLRIAWQMVTPTTVKLPTYADLMKQSDSKGLALSFLGSEEWF